MMRAIPKVYDLRDSPIFIGILGQRILDILSPIGNDK
jgi:hypothetical protein